MVNTTSTFDFWMLILPTQTLSLSYKLCLYLQNLWLYKMFSLSLNLHFWFSRKKKKKSLKKLLKLSYTL